MKGENIYQTNLSLVRQQKQGAISVQGLSRDPWGRGAKGSIVDKWELVVIGIRSKPAVPSWISPSTTLHFGFLSCKITLSFLALTFWDHFSFSVWAIGPQTFHPLAKTKCLVEPTSCLCVADVYIKVSVLGPNECEEGGTHPCHPWHSKSCLNLIYFSLVLALNFFSGKRNAQMLHSLYFSVYATSSPWGPQ